MSDRDTLHHIRMGDIDQYRHIVDAYHGQIAGYLRRKLYDRTQVDDLAQTVFIKYYKHIDQVDIDRPVLPYLYAIAANELKMYYRSTRGDVVQLEEAHTQIHSHAPTSMEVEDEVSRALAQLQPHEREVLELYADGYKYHEIADMLRKPLNTVKTLIRRARISIRSHL